METVHEVSVAGEDLEVGINFSQPFLDNTSCEIRHYS